MVRRSFSSATVAILTAGLFVGGLSFEDASARDGTKRGLSRADHGVKALEKLPWEAHVIRANLSSERPVAIAGCYLMRTRLLVVSAGGRLFCLDRRDLEPRWVNTLRHPLAQPPVESSTHYCFLMKDHMGAHWVQTISKRTGSAGDRFPVRLPFSVPRSAGIAANSGMVFVPSLGSPGNNRTLETVNTISGRRGWGYRTTGLLMATPVTDPEGDILILAGDDGVVTSLSGAATAPKAENWVRKIGGIIKSRPACTPAHVIVASSDGIVYSLDLFSGRVNWLVGLDEAIRAPIKVLGGYQEIEKSTGVEGASPVKVRRYVGTAFARNVNGLHAVDLVSGKKLFTDARGGRALCRKGKLLVTCNSRRTLTFRDATDGYKVTGSLDLGMFDLIPTNSQNGEIFACTSDGTVLAAIPK